MKLRVFLVALASLVLASPAMACVFDTWDLGANCDGYYANGTLRFGDLITEYVILNVTLSQAGSPVCTYAETVGVDPYVSTAFSFSGGWCTELCGDFEVNATLEILSSYPDTKYFSTQFTCECDHACRFTPGYWKNHPEAWPVSSLVVGGHFYTKAQLLNILGLPVVKDPTVICAHHLIAAMLNVANGTNPSIQPAIDAANALLAAYPIGSNPKGAAKTAIINAKNALAAYNETVLPGCPGYYVPVAGAAAAPVNPAQSASWGAIKNIYR